MSCQCNADLYCCSLSFINRGLLTAGLTHPGWRGPPPCTRSSPYSHHTADSHRICSSKNNENYFALFNFEVRSHESSLSYGAKVTSDLGLKYYFRKIKEFRLAFGTSLDCGPFLKTGSMLKVCSHLTSFSPFNADPFNSPFFLLALCQWWWAEKRTEWAFCPFS